MSMDFSIVEYCAEQNGYRCGYCKSTNTNYSHGMWAHTMTVDDYQDLIDRGWRRSGMYCYKPTMDRTCCPMYTIRCMALDLKLSRSQKKVLKRMNAFLTRGETQVDRSKSAGKTFHMEVNYEADIPGHRAMSLRAEKNSDASQVMSVDESIHRVTEVTRSAAEAPSISNATQAPAVVLDREGSTSSAAGSNTLVRGGASGRDDSRPPCRKAKLVRLERKQRKLMSRGLSQEEALELIRSRRRPGNHEGKSLEQFLEEATASAVGPGPVHRLEVRLVQSQPQSQEFQRTVEEAHALYRKYQGAVHGEPPTRCTMHQFMRFLVKSPLQLALVPVGSRRFEQSAGASHALFAKYQMSVHGEPEEECSVSSFNDFLVATPITPCRPSDGPPSGYGSFHQQYWLDGRLVAVGVIDVLPRCVSSVYFYYDPELSQLSLGTYASLRELAFTRSLHKTAPSLRYYYMGFYIHTCPKMRYKASYSPSFLLCPETYLWFPVEACRPKLDRSKYSRFCEDQGVGDRDGQVSLGQVLVLWKHTAMRFSAYAAQSGPEPDGVQEVEQYAQLVGMTCARRMLLVRS